MWTEEMCEELKIHFIDKSKEFLEKYFGKSYSNIEKKARTLKIKRRYSSFKWCEKECEELKIYFIDKSKEFLEEHFNRSYDTIRKKANSLNIKKIVIKKPNIEIDIEYVKILNNDENKKNVTEISKILNVKSTYLYKILKNIGFEYKNHHIYKTGKKSFYKPKGKRIFEDSNFFEKIDSEDKAYFLGFIFADGCIYKNKKSQGGSINIHIHRNDIEILEMFKKSLQSTATIYTNGDYSLFRIFNKKMLMDIEKLGCVERKSLILDFPKIEDEYISHFMRGYFDGDGSIRYLNNKIRICRCGITSSHVFCEKYMNILIEKCNINKIKSMIRGNFSSFDYGGRGNCTKIYNFLYKDANIFLKRKKDKFEEVIYK